MPVINIHTCNSKRCPPRCPLNRASFIMIKANKNADEEKPKYTKTQSSRRHSINNDKVVASFGEFFGYKKASHFNNQQQSFLQRQSDNFFIVLK